jgi:hypothetical protein
VCFLSEIRDDPGSAQRGIEKILPDSVKSVLPGCSLNAAAGHSKPRTLRSREERVGSGLNVVPTRPFPPPCGGAMQLPNSSREDQQGLPARSVCTSLHLFSIGCGEHPGEHPDIRLAQLTSELLISLGSRSTVARHFRRKNWPPNWRQWDSLNGSFVGECAIVTCSLWLKPRIAFASPP